eukprot:TRINITY_DN10985_c0_g1_i1.p1 TRINITY_DN10985_c0_g1~~TRINITY_DN10985_c0_g1_i1.p1  ORF type:complete len:850 (+),score=214.15 TRINITY_DN10985_c0_g1_i1:31-2580(+)
MCVRVCIFCCCRRSFWLVHCQAVALSMPPFSQRAACSAASAGSCSSSSSFDGERLRLRLLRRPNVARLALPLLATAAPWVPVAGGSSESCSSSSLAADGAATCDRSQLPREDDDGMLEGPAGGIEREELAAARTSLLQQRSSSSRIGVRSRSSDEAVAGRGGWPQELVELEAAFALLQRLSSNSSASSAEGAAVEEEGGCTDAYGASCDHWASSGECQRNRQWMADHCKKACKICVASQAGGASCTDSRAECPGWARTGECQKNLWVMTNCGKSCDKSCGGGGGAATNVCADKDAQCMIWAQSGQCQANPHWMGDHCAKSCGKCSGGTTPHPGGGGGGGGATSCKDEDANCVPWAHNGYCASSKFMKEKCKKSCNLCGGGGGGHSSSDGPHVAPQTDPNCKDRDQKCGDWAAEELCTKQQSYVAWMKANCAKSCGHCGGAQSAALAKIPVYRGFAYGPSPMLKEGTLPNDDFMMDGAAPLWNGTGYSPEGALLKGRNDLAVMRALGANMVRLYGNDPQWDHKNFFDHAHQQGLKVVVGMSDWPYTQMNSPPNCKMTNYLCYKQLYDSYKQNLDTGGFLVEPEKKEYHPALGAIIVMNEPELKIGNTGAETIDSAENLAIRCRILASAWDAMLQVEKDLGVRGKKPHFTITFSFAQFNHPAKHPALGQMEYWWDCVNDPVGIAGYTPKNDLRAAFLDRWINSMNCQIWADIFQKQLLEPYKKSIFYSSTMQMPLFIGEYHSLNDEGANLQKDLELLYSYKTPYPFFKGFAFFEFTKRYDKGSGGKQDEFGMFAFGEREVTPFKFFGENYSIRCLKKQPALNGQAMSDAFANAFKHKQDAADRQALQEAFC